MIIAVRRIVNRLDFNLVLASNKKMKKVYLLILILFTSCSGKKASTDAKSQYLTDREVVVTEFQALFDSANVAGAILSIYISQ